MTTNMYVSHQQDKRLQTEQITPELVAYVVEKIVTAISPVKIILFGSAAARQAKSDSDLDLLVVHDTAVSNRQVRRQIEYLLWGRRFGVDLIVRRPEEIAHNVAEHNPFYTKHILDKGLILYERARKTTG